MSWFNATSPFARMTVDDDGIVVRVLGLAAFQTGWQALIRAERVICERRLNTAPLAALE
jgi:hypothetical protein